MKARKLILMSSIVCSRRQSRSVPSYSNLRFAAEIVKILELIEG